MNWLSLFDFSFINRAMNHAMDRATANRANICPLLAHDKSRYPSRDARATIFKRSSVYLSTDSSMYPTMHSSIRPVIHLHLYIHTFTITHQFIDPFPSIIHIYPSTNRSFVYTTLHSKSRA